MIDNIKNNSDVGKKKLFFNIKALKETDIKDIPWLIQNLILKNGIHMLVGAPASTKSLLILLIALEAISQKLVLGKFKVNEKIKIMILDKENSIETFIVRLKLLETGHDIKINLENIEDNYLLFSDYAGIYFDEEKGNKEKIIERIQKDNINLLIIDSLVRFFRADENLSSESNRINEALKEITKLDCSVLFLHHLNKSGVFRGSSDIQAFCDIVYVLERENNQFTLSNKKEMGGKMRNSEEIEPISYEIETDKVDDKVVALRLKYISADIETKIEFKNTSQGFYEGREYEKEKALEIINLSKKYLKENNLEKFKTKDLINYLNIIFSNEKLVKDNFYGKDGALQMMIKEGFLKPMEKKGWYTVKF